MSTVRLAIVGSRSFNDMKFMAAAISEILPNIITPGDDLLIVSGGAQGADELAVKLAKDIGVSWHIFHADWDNLGKRAGYVRNVDIVNGSDHVVAFWDGTSKGTKHTIDLAEKAGKLFQVIRF